MSASVPDVVDVLELRAPTPLPGTNDLVIEIPHGAVGDWEYHAVATRLESRLPADLIEFFHVNTDSGAAELAVALGERLCARGIVRRVVIVRSRIPRTFIDCNRVLGADLDAYRAGGVTPGIPPWVTTPADHAFLGARYAAYQAVASALITEVCAAGGRALLLHTYAPRTVDVEVTADIVPALRAAYQPDRLESWPLRPEVDLIFRDPQGTRHLPNPVVDGLRKALAMRGYPLAEGATYPLHPVTTGHAHVVAWPGRVVCVEVRRDLLTERFVPFRQVQIDGERVGRLADGFADWLTAWTD
ncbi:MAG: hypothetical protein EXR71_04050 [Myxococcales bacterium]|nr:hypothetical protein [Myxococcales bacterium]